jgi:prefoldin subunit 5
MKQSVFCEYNLKEEKEELTKLIKVLESRLTTMAQKMKNSREKTEYY